MSEYTKGEIELIYEFGFRVIIKNTNRTIFRVTQNDGKKPILSDSEVRANGKELVHRWNCHDDLLEACELLLDSLIFVGSKVEQEEKANKLGRVAIAKAKQ